MNSKANQCRSSLLTIINKEINHQIKIKSPMKINHLTPKEIVDKYETIQIEFDNPVIVSSVKSELYQEIKSTKQNTQRNSVQLNHNFLEQKSKEIFQSQTSPLFKEKYINNSHLTIQQSVPLNNASFTLSDISLSQNSFSVLKKRAMSYLKNVVSHIKIMHVKYRNKQGRRLTSKFKHSNAIKDHCSNNSKKTTNVLSQIQTNNKQNGFYFLKYYAKHNKFLPNELDAKFKDITLLYIQ